LDDASRGFSFSRQGALDMRFDPSRGETAAELLNRLNETEIRNILKRYGEEKASRKLAKAIIENRPIETTEQLVNLIISVKGDPRRGRIHPATLVFQALRIVVNSELTELENGLIAGLKLLKEGGFLVVISFHSLEDRIVKQFIRVNSKQCICPPKQPICTCNHEASLQPVNRKVVRPGNGEIASNPRSRSAKLRVAQKLAGGHV
jgi:16S rRNA (cytosine1402-N4)-methyltransferase